MDGNANVGTGQFIGTVDATDLEFRANDQPQLRLGSDGVTELLGGVRMEGLDAMEGDISAPVQFLMYDPVTKGLGLGGQYPKPIPDCWGTDQSANFVGSWVNTIDPGTGYFNRLIPNCPQINVGIGTSDTQAKLVVQGLDPFYKTVEFKDYQGIPVFEIFNDRKMVISSETTVQTPTGQEYLHVSDDGETRIQLDNDNIGLHLYNNGIVRIGGHHTHSSIEVGTDRTVLIRNGAWNASNPNAYLYLGNSENYINAELYGGLKFGVTGVPDAMVIEDYSGKVGIGVGGDHTFGEGLLEVNGTIRSQKVVVEESGWPDFVFDNDHELRPLPEIQNYIDENGHLPDIPSAKQIETDGLDLGELVKLQMQKIEELTLYVIELERRISEKLSE